MDKWWEQLDKPEAKEKKKSITYYRHSAQDRQENSIQIQSELIHKFAKEHGIEIIKEFADYGKSGLSTDKRDGFNEMLDEWVKKRDDFEYILVLDVSRWGRFQDIDLSAAYSSECKKHGKQVVYTNLGIPREDDPLYQVYLSFERSRAAQYSSELSGKVFHGCKKIAEQGYRPGGIPPYGLHRLLLDESRKPVQILEPGERKSIQNQRVTLAPGDKNDVKVVLRIFNEFVKKRKKEQDIAAGLNQDGILSPGGARWDNEKVRHILTNELYIGTMVYNKTWQRLQAKSKRNPKQDWIRTPEAFEGIVSKELYRQAQEIFEERKRRYDPAYMLDRLQHIYRENGIVTCKLIKADMESPSIYSYRKHFKSLDMAFQKTFKIALEKTKAIVVGQIKKIADQIVEHNDFLVINNSFTVLVQPSVPVPCGYYAYWAFQPDKRPVVDITLGVPVSNSGKYEILGYIAMPRLMVRQRSIRIFSTSDTKLEMYGHNGLDMIKGLID
jgi:DNA invertase Pin-like site-specific DNA recombinase